MLQDKKIINLLCNILKVNMDQQPFINNFQELLI